ncbi:MAG: hypothetical protein QM755_21075 [Luteolibacter sp.]
MQIPLKRPVAILCAIPIVLGLSDHQAGAAEPDTKVPLKAPLSGLVQMGDIGFHRQDGGSAKPSLGDLLRLPGIFGGTVINITWQQLEPTPGTLDTKEIDRVLDEIRSYNSANTGCPIGVRLRVWPGPNAPVWAKNLGGAPVAVRHKGLSITVGRFWTKDYRDAWRSLQTRLAERYDAEPLIREVSNTSGSTMTDEAVLLPADAESVTNLKAAGFTDELFKACLLEAPADFARWRTTRVEMVCNPYRAIDSGKPKPNMEFTLKLMQHARQELGPRAVLSNHSLSKTTAEQLIPIYAEIQRLGPPIAFQTHSPNGLDWVGAMRAAVTYKAGSVELWNGTQFGGFETKSPDTLREWASWLQEKR